MPTGSGKTVSFSQYVARETFPTLTQVHRVELVSQISMTFARFGIKHRIIAPAATVRSIRNQHFAEFGEQFDHPSAQHAVASVDTLVSRYDKYRGFAATVGLVITDEAAHVLRENKWGRCMELFPQARLLGFTATPCRADGKGLGVESDGVFETMVQGPTVGELIAMGNLSDYKVIAKPSNLDVSQIKITGSGDYSGKELRTQSHESQIVGDVVQEYLKHASGMQGITFTVDVSTAEELAERFRQAGVPAAAVSAKTPEAERQESVQAFRRGEIKQLTNCDLFGEGFDVPGVEVVSLARPTASLSLYLQQVGRGLRPAPGKEHALIIDHVGNWERHGLPDTPRTWSLDSIKRRERRNEMADQAEKLTTCDSCALVFERKLLPKCPYCGHVRVPGSRDGPEQVDGDLTELDTTVLAALREKVKPVNPAEWQRRAEFAGGRIAGRAAYKRAVEQNEAREALRTAIEQWGNKRRDQGQSDKQSYREFYITFGVDVLTCQSWKRKDMDALRERILENA
jgi:superfamily II DNA or RNA helicase